MATAGEAAGKRRQTTMLIVLGLLAAVALWVNRGMFMPDGTADTVEGERVALGERIDRLAALPGLDAAPRDASSRYRSGRDLFDFGLSPARLKAMELEAIKAREAQERREERERERKERLANAPPPPPPKPAEPKAPDFQYNYVAYLGAMNAPDDFVAVLQKTGARREPRKEDILVVRKGELIDEAFVVKRIGIDEVEIGYVDPRFEKRNKVVRLIQPQEERGRRRR